MTLDGVFTEGYKKLVGELKDDQEKYLRVIAEAREMPVEWIEKADGIFIPNNDFMYFLFGQGILQFDCYRNGQCIWDNALIFPVRGADDRVAGFAGFFPFKIRSCTITLGGSKIAATSFPSFSNSRIN